MALTNLFRFTPNPRVLHMVIRPAVHFLCILPALVLVFDTWRGELGVNPIETLTHTTGEWGLRMLLLSLAISPLIKLSGNAWLIILRRPIGLYVFFYAFVHFLIYLIFDQSLQFQLLLEDVIERPYITVGFAALVLLIPLVFTSTKAMRRKLAKHWARLHRLVYLIGLFAVVHFIWLTRADFREPLIYAGIFGALMAFRLIKKTRKT